MVYIVPEVVEELCWRGEDVGALLIAQVLVIAFSRAQHTHVVHDEGQPILEAMSAAGQGCGYLPYDQLHKCVFGNDAALAEQQGCLHVGEDNNTPLMLSMAPTIRLPEPMGPATTSRYNEGVKRWELIWTKTWNLWAAKS